MPRRQSLVVFILSAFIASVILSISILMTYPNDVPMPTLAVMDNVLPSATIQHYTASEHQAELDTTHQFIVQFDDTVESQADAETLVADLGAEWMDDIPAIQGAVIKFENAIEPEQLETLSSALVIEPNYMVQSLSTYPTNDPMLDLQWAWTKIDIPRLWDSTDLNSDVTIAVVDSGVCFSHPDLQGRLLNNGFDFVDNDDDPSDQMGHGCAISGIIAANLDNGIGIAGIAPNVKILPIRVLDAQGVGSYANVISAIFYAVDHGASIINLSLGGQNQSQLLEQAIDYAIDHGVQVVAGTGNTGQEGVLYPARYSPVIAVGSHDINGNRSSFSTYGAEVDVLAPGENIVGTNLNGDYGYYSGTSMAAPHISALLALSGGSVKSIDFDDLMSTPQPTPTIDLTHDYVQALATNTPAPPVPTMTPTSTPHVTPTIPTSTPSSFQCSDLVLEAGFPSINSIDIHIYNLAETTPLESIELHFPDIPGYPDHYVKNLYFNGVEFWAGDGTLTSPLYVDQTVLSYDNVDRWTPVNPVANYAETTYFHIVFADGPIPLSDYWINEFLSGTELAFHNPNDPGSPCVLRIPEDVVEEELPPNPPICDDIYVNMDFSGNRLMMQVRNNLYQIITLDAVDLRWTLPVAYPDFYLSDLEFKYSSLWSGNDQVPGFDTDDLLGTDKDIFLNADRTLFGRTGVNLIASFEDGPDNLISEFDFSDFAGTTLQLSTGAGDCYIEPTPVDPIPGTTPEPTPTSIPNPVPATVDTACDYNVASSDSTSLINTMTTALGDADPDVVCLGGGTYLLDDWDNGDTTDGHNGLPTIDSEITIVGNNATIERTSGTPQFRFFNVTETGTLNLYETTLKYGYANGGYGYGGAIYSEGILNVVNSTFTDNYARNGAAIYPYLGEATIQGSEFSHNEGEWGGAIQSGNTSTILDPVTLNVSDTLFFENTAERGGAIFNRNFMHMNFNRFIGNVATEHSAVLYSGVNSPTTQFSQNCVYGNSSANNAIITSDNTLILFQNWWGDPRGLSSNQTDGDVWQSYNLQAPPADCMQVDSLTFYMYTGETVDFTLNTSSNGTPPYTYTNLTPVNYGVLTGTFPSYSYTATYQGDQTYYTVTDANGYSVTGKVKFHLTSPLVPRNHYYVTDWDTAITLSMEGVGGIKPTTFSEPSTPLYGTISGTAPLYEYTVNSSTFPGEEIITYDVTDSRGDTVTNSWIIRLTDLVASDADISTSINTSVALPITITGGLPPYTVSESTPLTLGDITGSYPNLIFTPFNDVTGYETITLDITDQLGNSTSAEFTVTVCETNATYTIADGDVDGLMNAINASQNPVCEGDLTTIELAPNGDYVFDEMIPIDVYSSVQQRTALPIISTNLQIIGNGATLRRADHAPTGRILTIIQEEGESIYIENLRIMNGYQAGEPNNAGLRGHGGGMSIEARSTDTIHTVTLDSIVFENNNADSIGAALTIEGDPVIVRNSAFIRNGLSANVEALYTDNYATFNTFENNIFYANGAEGLVDSGRNLLRFNSFWNNQSRSITTTDHYAELEGNIFGEAGSRSCYALGHIVSLGYNLGSDRYCNDKLIGVGDLTEVPSGITALVYTNDSIVPVLALSSDSPALDAIPSGDCSLATDILGTSRPQDSDGDGVPACNIGAFENLTTDFIVEKTASQTTVNHGDVVDFTIAITNNGGHDASGVVVADVLSTNLRYISSNATQGEYDTDRAFWTVGDLGIGETETLTLTVTVYLPLETNTTINTAQFIGASVLDSNHDDNDSAEVSVNCPVTDFNISDGDTDGLISAIIIANNETCFPGADTITLATDGTYTFDDIFSDLNALPSIASEIIINGNNATITRPASSSSELRFFNIEPDGDLTLNDLTLSYGNLPEDSGGAIYSEGTLSLNNTVFSENIGSPGGAIYQQYGMIDIQNSQFLNNKTPVDSSPYNGRVAGAIGLVETEATINQTEFIGNQARASGYWFYHGGGAMKVYESNVTITNSLFQDNRTYGGNGGAIYVSENDSTHQITILSTSFVDNYSASSGGAILSDETTISIDRSLFWGNTASSGSGGALSANHAASVHNSTFYENSAWQNGAISMSSIAADMSHLTIVGNHTSRSVTGAITFSGGPIKYFILANNTGGYGNCSSKFTDTGGYNVSDDDSCGFDQPTDLNEAEITLSTFGYHGNTIQSFIPQSANLIDVIPSEVCTGTIDQHGTIRPIGGACDIGAVEVTGNEILPPQNLYITQGNIGDIPKRDEKVENSVIRISQKE